VTPRAVTIGAALALAAGVVPVQAASPVDRAACKMPRAFLERTARGVYGSRSGDIQIVTPQPDFVGPGYPHSGPWPYLQRVPLLLYGPGHVRPGVAVGRPVTAAALAPTFGELVGFDLPGAVEGPLAEALVPPEERPEPPRLVMTVVWDGGGRIVLRTWPKAWPNLKALIGQGTWYGRATVGSSPSVTPAVHATIGTGVFPDEHGLTDQTMRIKGRITTPWAAGPSRLERPTLSDLFDLATGNVALVGAVATEPGHLGMIGHGSSLGGGDPDVAVLKSGSPGARWGLPGPIASAFSFPSYVNDVGGLAEAARALDRRDGRRDGRWRTNPIAGLKGGFDTPARIPYQTEVVRELIRREGFGDDEVPDLLFVNHKIIDLVGHRWTLNSPEMRDAVRAQDADLPVLMQMLDEEVGPGRWVLALTADHGINPNPSVSGAVTFDRARVARAIAERFDDADGVPLVQAVRPTQIFLRRGELRGSLHAVARFLLGLRRADVAAGPVPAGKAGGPAFQAAFPTARLASLPCAPS
jgi:hypothetical protein